MTRKLKALGLALIAVFAMSALAAGSASAAEFHSNSETTHIEAVQTTVHVFNTTAGKVTCEIAKFTGTAPSKTVTSLTVTPTYEKCHIIFGFKVEANVTPNGCTYTLYAAGTADVNCPEGKVIEVVAAGCTVKVGAQKGLKSVSYTNKQEGVAPNHTWHIDATLNFGGISSSHSGFSCGTGSSTTGTLTGGATVTGKDTTGKPTTIWYT